MHDGQRVGGRAQRLTACQLLADGVGSTAIANSLGVTRQTVYRWKQLFDTGGAEAVVTGYQHGRPAKLTSGQVDLLRRALQQSPQDLGYGAGPWSLKSVARFIRTQLGVSYGDSNVSRLLLSLGLSVKDLR